MTLIRAIKIIVAPALTPLIQLFAVIGFAISLLVIVFGVFVEPLRGGNRFRHFITTVQVKALAKAVEEYKADCGKYPSAHHGLNSLIRDPGVEGWRGPYLNEVSHDLWGRPFIYLPSANSVPEILSYGADGKPGGEFFDADVRSRNPPHPIPESPFEVRARRFLIGIWIAAWFCLIGSMLALRRSYRPSAST